MKKKARPVKAPGPPFKVPDVKADRGLVVKESKRDLKEVLEEAAPGIDNLAEMTRILAKAKKKVRRSR